MHVWLTSSGIDAASGGIASVTRSGLAALAVPGNPCDPGSELVAKRFVGLRSATPPPELVQAGAGIGFRNCSGSRLRFLLETLRQASAKPDRILYEHVDLAQCQTLLPSARRRPWALWGHGIELWRELPRRKERALREADLLLFNSAFTREKAAHFHPWILERPFRVVPLCREESICADRSDGTCAIPSRGPILLTVGRLLADRPKGHLEILEAMPLVLEVLPEARWHIVGDGPWKGELAARVARSPARDAVVLHGFLSNSALRELYRSARVFAMPSHGEGFGLVYAEAMAEGLPCLGSTLDAAPEVIGEGGDCVDLAEEGALARALVDHLGADEASFARRSEAARRRASFFSLPRFARDLRAALASMG